VLQQVNVSTVHHVGVEVCIAWEDNCTKGQLRVITYQRVIFELTRLRYKHQAMPISALGNLFLLGWICLSNRTWPDLCMGGLNLLVVEFLLG